MIYIATLNRNGLVKIGRSDDPRTREKQLPRELEAKDLKLVRAIHVPHGWGTDAEWESELLEKVKRETGHLQLFAESERSREVADCSIEEAWAVLDAMLARTEIDKDKDAPAHDDERVDWRFYRRHSGCHELRTIQRMWRSLCHRQEFINSLRGDKGTLISRAYFEADLERYSAGQCEFPGTAIMQFHDNGEPWIPDF